MNNIKVSIIIPVYNPGKLLIDCLESVLNQTLKEIEIICINDGSTDGSEDILKEYASKDNRFKVFNQKNLGAALARNKGIKTARGEYIVFLDSDDWIEKDMCEVLYNHAKKLDVDIVLFNTIRHLEDNKTQDLIHFEEFKENYETYTFDYHYIKDKVINGYFGVIWSKFYKSSFIKDNKITFTNHKMFNDVEFHIKSMLLAKKMAYYPKILYHYIMIGQESLQQTYVGKHESICFYDVMVGVKEFLEKYKFMDEFRIEYLDYTLFYFKLKLKQMNDEFKQEYYLKIKNFLENEHISLEEFSKITNRFIPFYLHILNTNNYAEYKIIQDKFDGEHIKLNNNHEYIKYIEYNENYTLTSNKIYENLLENKINELNKDVKNKDIDISNLKKTFNELQDKNKNLENINKINNENKQEINKLNDIITKKNREISNLQKELSTHVNLINELKIDINQIKILQNEILNENAKLNEDKLKITNEYTELKDKLSKSSKLINNLKINLDELQIIQNDLINENTNLINENNKINNELKKIKSSTFWKIKTKL